MFSLEKNSFVLTRDAYKYNILRTVFTQNGIPVPKILYAAKGLQQNIYDFIKGYAIPNKLDHFIMYEDDAWPCTDLSGLYNTLNTLSNRNFRGILCFGYSQIGFDPKTLIHDNECDYIYSDNYIRLGGSQAYLVTSDCYNEVCDVIKNKEHIYPYDNMEYTMKKLAPIYMDITLSACRNIYYTKKSYFAQLNVRKKKFLYIENDFTKDGTKWFKTEWFGADYVHHIKNTDILYNFIFKKFPEFNHELQFDKIDHKNFMDPIFINTSKLSTTMQQS